jgi:SAM-dependent methyltransferase
MSTTIDLGPLKAVHRTTWASGDYTAVADAYVGEVAATALAAAQIAPGSDVLDVAAGSGNAAIPAASAGARVTALDLVPELLAAGESYAEAAGVEIDWVQGDAEDLPFADASFDVAFSVVGVQFTPRHEATAAELARVTRPRGRIVLAHWTPEGFIGRVFRTMAPYMPKPPAGASSPPLYGDEDHIRSLFAGHDVELSFERHHAIFHAESAAAWVEFMADHYGPILKAREKLSAAGRWEQLEADLVALCEEANEATEGFSTSSEYVVVHARKIG